MAGVKTKKWLKLTEKQREGEYGKWDPDRHLYLGRIPDGQIIEFESYEAYHEYMSDQKED